MIEVSVYEHNNFVGLAHREDYYNLAFVCPCCGELWARAVILDLSGNHLAREKCCPQCWDSRDHPWQLKESVSPTLSTIENLKPSLSVLKRDFLWLTRHLGEEK